MGRSPWVALEATTDRRQRARELIRAHRGALDGSARHGAVRDVVRESWGRSAAAGVDPAVRFAPVRLSDDETRARLESGPLAFAPPVLRRLREDVQAEDEQIVLLCDPDGTILWIDGDPRVLDRAQGINLQLGAQWSEDAVGTNAMGTALAVDHAVQIFSAEHFAEPVHEWTCAAAPLHDPETGEKIGVIDLSGELSTAHPHTLALVESAARLIESLTLRERREADERRRERARDEGAGSLLVRPRRDKARPTQVEALGRDRIRVAIGGRTVSLSKRHSELLLTLHLRPGGMTAEEIAIAVWGERAKPVSARAELSRLRRILGPLLDAQPYRLRCEVAGDFDAVRAAVDDGRVAEALDGYPGPLLPRSEVPVVVEARQSLDGELRSALLAGGDPSLLERWLSHPAGEDDAVACRELLSLLPEGDRRRPAALAHLRRITSGLGTAGS